MAHHLNEKRVAVLGMGRMGSALAKRLRAVGFGVIVWNRTHSTAEKVARTIGAEVAETPDEAAAAADVTLSSLADDEAVRDVYTGAHGVASGLKDGAVVAEMSTIAPRTVREIVPEVELRNAFLLDAPVSGSVAFAEKGELTIMVGGKRAALERAREVLEALSSRLFHIGGLGTGATMKLAVNALLHGLNIALCEALVLAEEAGVERSVAYDVFAAGAVGAPFLHYKRAAFELPDEAPTAFSLELSAKDLDLILGLAAEAGVHMHQAEATRSVVRGAVAAGLGKRDLSAVAIFLRQHH
ncbi:MAG TPA: NAD(P)-dependent oxidoreductase [Actinomycetota bacterium]|jgi:3-hydroxyisobutyrate dehydrogenase/2-hydroxy-3-oxopropionate reductase|nr:NAD(P)-dependent oxidoreductase [Actinomycetota bacterium]